jgi:hypothetical protein
VKISKEEVDATEKVKTVSQACEMISKRRRITNKEKWMWMMKNKVRFVGKRNANEMHTVFELLK